MLSGSGLPRVRVGRASAPSPPAAILRQSAAVRLKGNQAADADHSSFGCGAQWTYFGGAFFISSMRRTANLRQPYVGAGAGAKRELRNGFPPPPSNHREREYRATVKGKARLCRRGFPDGLRQRHHAAPELVLAAHVHIVLAHEVKLAIGTDSVNRKSRGKHLDGGAVAHRERDLARSDQHTSGRTIIDGHKFGFCKLIADVDTSRILGCHVVGERAVDIVQVASIVIAGGMRVDDLAAVPLSVPTYEGILFNAAASVARQLGLPVVWRAHQVEGQWRGNSATPPGAVPSGPLSKHPS